MKQMKNKKMYKQRKDPIKAAAEYGIDIEMLKANLARPLMERIRRHQIALDTYNILRKENLVGPIDEMRDRGDGKLAPVFTVDALIKSKKAISRL
jgi:hypothetical protein